MDVINLTRPRTPGDLIALEHEEMFTRDRITILGGSGSDRVIPQFSLLGQVLIASLAVVAAKAANASAANGVITGSTVAAGTKTGLYVATCIGAVANGGKFTFEDPDGIELGEIVVGVAFTLGGITATIADGSTDWAEGDQVIYTVTATAAATDGDGNFKYVAWSPTATDGSQVPAAVSIHPITAYQNTDAPATALARGPAIIRKEEIAWPNGLNGAQTAAAIAALAARNILVRTSG